MDDQRVRTADLLSVHLRNLPCPRQIAKRPDHVVWKAESGQRREGQFVRVRATEKEEIVSHLKARAMNRKKEKMKMKMKKKREVVMMYSDTTGSQCLGALQV